MQSFLSLDHLKHRYVVALVASLFTMVFPMALIAQELDTGGPDRPGLPGEVSPLTHEEISDSPWAPVLSMSIDDLDEYVDSQDYLIEYLFERDWSESVPLPLVVLWDDADPTTDHIILWPTMEPNLMDVELVRSTEWPGQPPYEDYPVVGTGTFVEAARFDWQAFTPITGTQAFDAEVIAGELTSDNGVTQVLWGLEYLFTFADEENGADLVLRGFLPMEVLANLDQAIPDAYAFSKVLLPPPNTGKPPSGILDACPVFPLSMCLSEESPGKGVHPCLEKARAQIGLAQVALVTALGACFTGEVTASIALCTGCVGTTVGAVVCFIVCVGVIILVALACCYLAREAYRFLLAAIAADVKLCCRAAGDCPQKVPGP